MASDSSPAKLFENFDEVPKPVQCRVKGKIPEWLNVTLLRNGPGMFSIGDSSYNHWFDGLAFIQRYHFENEKMFYSAKYLKSYTYEKNMASQRIVVGEFGTYKYPDPCKNIFSRYFTYLFEDKYEGDNANINILQCGDEVFACGEGPILRRIDPKTLETYEQMDLSNYVAVNINTAHHHVMENGTVLNIGSRFGKDPHYVFVRTDPSSKKAGGESRSFESSVVLGEIAIADKMHPSYYHSFGMTENYFVLFESPYTIDVYKLLTRRFFARALSDTMQWQPEKKTRVHIFNWRTGKAVSVIYEMEPFFTFHHANAYERDGCLVVDYCKYLSPAIFVDNLSLGELRKKVVVHRKEDERSFLHRAIIPLDIGEDIAPGYDLLANKKWARNCRAIVAEDRQTINLEDQRICPTSFEFPRYNYDYNTQRYQFCYGAVLQPDASELHGIIKADVNSRTHMTWKKDHAQQICAEPVFVPKPGATAEDDGVILCPIMTYKDDDKPFVLVLDAKTFKELARCQVDERLPMGFHAQFIQN